MFWKKVKKRSNCAGVTNAGGIRALWGLVPGVGACGGTIPDGHRRTVKVTPQWRVYALGATLCVALTICSGNFSDRGGPYFMASLTLAGIAYLLAIREFFATPKFPRRVIVVGLVL